MSIWRDFSEQLRAWIKFNCFATGFRAIFSQYSASNRRQVAFTAALIALSAKMAKADGAVTYEEVEAFTKIIEIPHDQQKNVYRLFQLAQQDIAGYEIYAKQIKQAFETDQDVLLDVLECLFFIAKADGILHQGEIEFLQTIGRVFGQSTSQFQRKLEGHLSNSDHDPYLVLGLDETASQSDITSKYKELVRKYHPDQMIARGVPHDLIALANHRMAIINVAYEELHAN